MNKVNSLIELHKSTINALHRYRADLAEDVEDVESKLTNVSDKYMDHQLALFKVAYKLSDFIHALKKSLCLLLYHRFVKKCDNLRTKQNSIKTNRERLGAYIDELEK